jgi:hypothetical protein
MAQGPWAMTFDRERLRTNARPALTMIAALVFTTSACLAQSAWDVGDLDPLLAAKDWNKLGAALSSPARYENKAIDWLDARLKSEGYFFVGWLYARELWSDSNHAATDALQRDLRLTAGAVTLYTAAVILVDGAKCEDQTAPVHRMDQLFQARGVTLAFMKQQLGTDKQRAIDFAVALEAKTASARGSDDLVCRDGMAQMRAGFDHGTLHQVPTAPGAFGKTVEVEAPPDWRPTVLAEADYRPKQEAVRANLSATLAKLIM